MLLPYFVRRRRVWEMQCVSSPEAIFYYFYNAHQSTEKGRVKGKGAERYELKRGDRISLLKSLVF